MKRDALKELGLTDDQIDKVMAENGKDIEAAKAKFADYDDLKGQLKTANDTLDKFKDYDQTKADVEKYKAELKKAQEESALKIAKMERQAKIREYTGSKKFVNEFTKNSIESLLDSELDKKESEGKSLDDLFKKLTDGKDNILAVEKAPQPPVTVSMQNKQPADTASDKIRAVMGLGPKK